LRPEEVKLADQLVQSLSAPFKPEHYHDTFQEQLNALIEAKLKGKAVAAPARSTAKAPVIDMMEALKRSLAKDAGKPVPKPQPVAPARSRKKAS